MLWAILIFVLLSIPTNLVVPSGSGRLLDVLPDAIAEILRLLADKVVHAALFGAQAAWLLKAGVSLRRTLVWTSLYGAATELYQIVLPFRSGDGLDLLADVVGGLLVVGWEFWRQRGRASRVPLDTRAS